MAGGALLCLLPPAQGQEPDALSLQFSPDLGTVGGPPPRFREEPASAGAGRPGRTASEPPFRRSDFSLRLARLLDVEGVSLQASTVLDAVPKTAPSFREDGGPDLRLTASGGVGMGPFVPPRPLPAPRQPGPSNEFPLRLAQVMLPQAGSGRQPRWNTRYDTGLDLQTARRLGLVGPADGPAQGPQFPGQVPGQMLPGPAPLGPVGPSSLPQGEDFAGASSGPWQAGVRQDEQAALSQGDENPGRGIMGMGWTIPPIRWGGTVGYSLRRNSSDDGTRSLDQMINTNFRGASYIYAPWLASVSGSIGLISGVNRFSSGNGQDLETRNTSMVGNGNLDLFPSSRFPFNANFTRSDSRVASVNLASDYTENRLGLRQSYRSEDSLINASAGLDLSQVSIQGGAKDTVTAVSGSYSQPLWDVNNSANLRASVSQRDGTGEGAKLFSFNSTHAYTPDENFSVQAYSSYSDNDLRFSTGTSTLNQFRGAFFQLGTSATWRPEFEVEDDEDSYPLSLNAGLNYADTKMGGNTSMSQSQRVTGTTSAYYRFSPNLSVNGSGTMNWVTTGNSGGTGAASSASQLVNMLNGGIAYSGDPLTLGKFSYNWNSGANMSWLSGSGNMPTNLFAGVQAGHSLGRNFVLSDTDGISLSVFQNVAAYQNQATGNSSTLSNSASANYRLALGERFNGSVTTGYSDVITTGTNSQHYQTLNLGFNGYGQLTTRSSATVNLMWNWSDQTQKLLIGNNGATTTTNQRMSLNGNASFSHSRFANIPGLRYTFLFQADSLLRDNRLLGDPNAQAQRYRYTVDNRFDYRIGLLDLRLSGMVNELGGKKNALLFFQVTRQIGTY